MCGWKKNRKCSKLEQQNITFKKGSKTISVAFYPDNSGNKCENEKAVDVDCRPSSIIWQNLLQSLTMKGYIHWTEHIGQVAVLAYE